MTADSVHFVHDAASIHPSTTQIKLCEHAIHCNMRGLFLKKMLKL